MRNEHEDAQTLKADYARYSARAVQPVPTKYSRSCLPRRLQSATPTHLATLLYARLRDYGIGPPRLEVLVNVLDCLYFASLRTDEGRSPRLTVVYAAPSRLRPPKKLEEVGIWWKYTPFAAPLDLSIDVLMKTAMASDPQTSSLVVYPEGRRGLRIWGLVDQQNNQHKWESYESESGPRPPGRFQASVLAPGCVRVSIGDEVVGELKTNRLVRLYSDVLFEGPIRNALEGPLCKHFDTVYCRLSNKTREGLEPGYYDLVSHWWLGSVCRVLRRVQEYGHGGAILLSADSSQDGLNSKYRLHYDRLRTSLERRAVLRIERHERTATIVRDYVEREAELYPQSVFWDVHWSRNEEVGTDEELTEAIWFVSALTRVDGLLLMTPDLETVAFGVEITVSDPPRKLAMAGDVQAKTLSKLDYQHFGTRHRSMIRYCSAFPGSVGFVISQDGDVRAITSFKGKTILWDNIQLWISGGDCGGYG